MKLLDLAWASPSYYSHLGSRLKILSLFQTLPLKKKKNEWKFCFQVFIVYRYVDFYQKHKIYHDGTMYDGYSDSFSKSFSLSWVSLEKRIFSHLLIIIHFIMKNQIKVFIFSRIRISLQSSDSHLPWQNICKAKSHVQAQQLS